MKGARELATEVYDLLEARFWEPEAQLYVDEIKAGDWSAIDSYRGQNANMHTCEAMLCAFEATDEEKYLDRAHVLAKRVCVDLAAEADGLIWEHYTTDWTHDWDYNKEDPQNLFRPYGYLPGHFTEWAKLLLILERYRPEPWMAERARRLFDIALDKSWDHQSGGMHYTFAPDGGILDTDRYYWVLSETIAASALLALRTEDTRYWDWYDKAWAFSDGHFVDHEHGAWYRILNEDNQKYDNIKESALENGLPPVSRLLRGSGGKTPRRFLRGLRSFSSRQRVTEQASLNPETTSFTGAACLLFSERRLVLEVRKPAKWERVPGQPPRIGFGCIGGTIKEGETPLQALRREASEEIGCSIEVWSSPRTVCVSLEGVESVPGLEVDGHQLAMLWTITDPNFVVGSYVAVFLGRAKGDPQPGDLPAIVFANPELIPKIGFGSVSVSEVRDFGAEIRQNIELPPDGRLILANTLRHLMSVYQVDRLLFNEWMDGDSA